MWKFYNAVCTATSTFDKWHDIRCLRAEFTAKHWKAPLSLTTRWWMEPDLGSWQSPDISRSHLYRGTIAWTPPTAIYRAYTVLAYQDWYCLSRRCIGKCMPGAAMFQVITLTKILSKTFWNKKHGHRRKVSNDFGLCGSVGTLKILPEVCRDQSWSVISWYPWNTSDEGGCWVGLQLRFPPQLLWSQYLVCYPGVSLLLCTH